MGTANKLKGIQMNENTNGEVVVEKQANSIVPSQQDLYLKKLKNNSSKLVFPVMFWSERENQLS